MTHCQRKTKFLCLSIFLSSFFLFYFWRSTSQPFPRCAYFPMWCTIPARCLAHFSLCSSLFSLNFTACVGEGEGRRRILKKWMSEGKRWTYLSPSRPHTQNTHTHIGLWTFALTRTQTIKVLDYQGPHEPASGLNRLVQPCVCGCVCARYEEQQ